jgi:cyclic-di-GMP phosphodiesterase TipF (flagellum assembly factor)
MLRCVQVLRRPMVRNKDVGIFCNVAAATLSNPHLAQCLDFLEANRALAPSFVLEFKQATFRHLGPTEIENLAALSQRGYRFSIDHVTDLRIEPRDSPTAASVSSRCRRHCCSIQAELDLGHPPVRPSDLLGRFGIDLIAEKSRRARGGGPARL